MLELVLELEQELVLELLLGQRLVRLAMCWRKTTTIRSAQVPVQTAEQEQEQARQQEQEQARRPAAPCP